jgi:hypothetical protein
MLLPPAFLSSGPGLDREAEPCRTQEQLLSVTPHARRPDSGPTGTESLA